MSEEKDTTEKYIESFWTLVGMTGAGLLMMAVGSHYYWIWLIQLGIFSQVCGLLAGLWISRRGGGW